MSVRAAVISDSRLACICVSSLSPTDCVHLKVQVAGSLHLQLGRQNQQNLECISWLDMCSRVQALWSMLFFAEQGWEEVGRR